MKQWLGRQDSNLGMAESKSAALPLGYAPTVPESRIEPISHAAAGTIAVPTGPINVPGPYTYT